MEKQMRATKEIRQRNRLIVGIPSGAVDASIAIGDVKTKVFSICNLYPLKLFIIPNGTRDEVKNSQKVNQCRIERKATHKTLFKGRRI